jgi:hypothetical protein
MKLFTEDETALFTYIYLKSRVVRFFLRQYTKTGGKCTKLPLHKLPNCLKITKCPKNVPGFLNGVFKLEYIMDAKSQNVEKY